MLGPAEPACEAATADFVRARVTKLDLEQRIALTDGGGVLPFDVVSIDIGPGPDHRTIPGLQHGLSVRPIDQLVNAWRALFSEQVNACPPQVTRYVTTVVSALNGARIRISPRRARLLARSLVAATIVAGPATSNTFKSVLECSLPHTT